MTDATDTLDRLFSTMDPIPGVEMVERDPAVVAAETAINVVLVEQLGIVRINTIATGVVPATFGLSGVQVCAQITAHNDRCEPVNIRATARFRASELSHDTECLPFKGRVTVVYLGAAWDYRVTNGPEGISIESDGCRPI